MKTIYSLNGKKITKKALTEKIGAKQVKMMTSVALETMLEDPRICNDFYTKDGILHIEFSL